MQIRSHIRKELKEASLKRGGLLGGAGALLLLLAGTVMPVPLLQMWGVPILVCGLAFVAIGFAPYRKLCRLELKPHVLQLEENLVGFAQRGKPLFKMPKEMVERICYVEEGPLYGIACYLKRPLEQQIAVLDRHFDFEAFMCDSKERFEACDLFLPFFSQKNCEECSF